MNFFGDTVLLRAIEEEDLKVLAEFHNDHETAEMIEFSWPMSRGHQLSFYERNLGDTHSKRLVIEVPGDGVIGYTGLWGIDWINRRATNGIIIGRKDLRGRGLAADAIRTIARVAFLDLGLHRIDAEIYEFNVASLNLYTKKCGWVEEGRRRQYVFRSGKYWDCVLVGLTVDDYHSWKSSNS